MFLYRCVCPKTIRLPQKTHLSIFISNLSSSIIWKGMASIKECQQVLLSMFLSKEKVNEVFCHNCQRVTPSYFSPLRTSWRGPCLLFRCAIVHSLQSWGDAFCKTHKKHPQTKVTSNIYLRRFFKMLNISLKRLLDLFLLQSCCLKDWLRVL